VWAASTGPRARASASSATPTASTLAPAGRLGRHFAEPGAIAWTVRTADQLTVFEGGLVETVGRIHARAFDPAACRRGPRGLGLTWLRLEQAERLFDLSGQEVRLWPRRVRVGEAPPRGLDRRSAHRRPRGLVKARPLLAGALSLGAAALGGPRLWRAMLDWGATADEARRPLPGDDLLPAADLVATRAMSIGATPAQVWPWLIQLGVGRAGAYSYDWLDRLFGLDVRSSRRIVRELQALAVGDVIPVANDGTGLRVRILERERVLGALTDDGTWAWTWVLEPSGAGTRLLSRTRMSTAGSSLPARAATWLAMVPASWVMERRMLFGLRERAESSIAGSSWEARAATMPGATASDGPPGPSSAGEAAEAAPAAPTTRATDGGIRWRARPRPGEEPVEIAPDVFLLGPWGRTQTNVYLVRAGAAWALVDAGWEGDAARIEAAARTLLGPGAAPAAILLTHDHPDHAGAARALAGAWRCPVYLHPAEVPIADGDFATMERYAGPLDRWLVLPTMRALGERRRATVLAQGSLAGLSRELEPGGAVPGLDGWEWLPTPGHTPGSVSFVRRADRVVLTGDALVTLRVNAPAGFLLGRQGLSGPPWYTTWSPRLARAAIAAIATLEPAVVGGGHGRPLAGPGTAAAVRAFHAQTAGVRSR
jgi:glyoxylase-like metal-dependent hydrolase (beta-lactamase superfamily II)